MIRYFIFTILFLMLVFSCKNENMKETYITIDSLKLVDTMPYFVPEKYLNKNNYYANINIHNNSDTTLKFYTMRCTWQENWVSNSTDIFLWVEQRCVGNILYPYEIKAKQTKKFKGVIWINDSLKTISNQNLKLGFVLIRNVELSDLDNFYPILTQKIKNKTDIIWSESIKVD